MASLLALTFTWDPTIRGYLVVGVAVAVLCGSIYLLLATNLGNRLGFLVALSGLFGWMVLMGSVWWVYGIGYVGPDASWEVKEVVESQSATDTSAAVNADARDLTEGWESVAEDNPSRGELQAAADEALTGEEKITEVFTASSDYKAVAVYERGGKDPDALVSRLPLRHPPHYAVVQVQPVVPVSVLASPDDPCPAGNECYVLGETPPKAQADTSAPVFTVVLERDLGAKRLPAALLTVASLLVFGLCVYLLHERDKQAMANREIDQLVGAGGEADT